MPYLIRQDVVRTINTYQVKQMLDHVNCVDKHTSVCQTQNVTPFINFTDYRTIPLRLKTETMLNRSVMFFLMLQ